MDWMFGEGPCDNFRMMIFNLWLFNHYADTEATLLFNLAQDPEERRDLAAQLPEVAAALLEDVARLRAARPRQPKYWQHIIYT